MLPEVQKTYSSPSYMIAGALEQCATQIECIVAFEPSWQGIPHFSSMKVFRFILLVVSSVVAMRCPGENLPVCVRITCGGVPEVVRDDGHAPQIRSSREQYCFAECCAQHS
jgi:hypothetical protein